jgi:hypothetical protein
MLPYRFDTLEYSWVKATIGICMLTEYFVAKKHQQRSTRECRPQRSRQNMFAQKFDGSHGTK